MFEPSYKGNHIFFDISDITFNDLTTDANKIFDLMEESIIKNSDMKIMHKKLVILEEPTTQNGFTSILLLDESHFSCHCYSDIGLLALDLFTCGKTDTRKISSYFIEKLNNSYNCNIRNIKINRRFEN